MKIEKTQPLTLKWQANLRYCQPSVLITWGENGPLFGSAGAAVFKRFVQDIEFNLLKTGHFLLEEDAVFFEKIRAFPAKRRIR